MTAEGGSFICKNKKCGKDISDRTAKRNAGLCDDRFQEGLKLAAEEIAARDRNARNN